MAVTDDGGQLYFVSGLSLKSEPQPRGGIYRIVEGRIETFVVNPPLGSLRPQSYWNPHVSGGGEVVTYARMISCVGGSSCYLAGYPRTYSLVCVQGKCMEEALGGQAQVSRNGRYVVHVGGWQVTGFPPTAFRHLRDLDTGESTEIPFRPSHLRQALTSDGHVLGIGGTGLMLWSRQQLRTLPVAEVPENALINDQATWVLYETRPPAERRLRSFDLSSGRDILLARGAEASFQPSISNDGQLVLYVAPPAPGQPPQVFLLRPDGADRRQLTA
ncbi:MAG: hypothetical protein AAB225_01560, partial [Acidobacteriota bacterium]